MFALFVATPAILAEAPGKPVEFDAKVVEASSEGAQVKLMWMASRSGGAPSHFDIYIASGETENMDDFALLGTVEVDPNKPVNNGVYYYITDRLEPGTYTFYVIARNDDGSSERSVIRVVTIKKGDDKPKSGLFIVSKRTAVAEEGKPWEFFVKIEKTQDVSAITFTVDNAPDGLTIDARGLITWENPTAGRHVFTITVTGTLPNGETIKAVQEFVLEVGKKEKDDPAKPCTELAGTVKNADGKMIMEGAVTAWLIKSGSNNEENRVAVQKAAIRQGTYAMALPAGTYKLRVEGPSFYAEWYEDASEVVDAKSITITCESPRLEVSFVVDMMPEPTFHVASGRVYDAETEGGIENALVIFTARKADDKELARNYKEVKAETNADGYYQVRLVEGVTYIAHAIARQPNGARDKYLTEWYDNTNDASTATGIMLTENAEGIDFPMDASQTYNNGFGGTMKDYASGDGVTGKVIAYMIRSGNDGEPNKRFAVTVETDANGNYSFSNLEPGDYVVFGMPAERPNVPGWYVAGELAADSWKNATTITVGDVMLTVQHDILLDKVEKEKGRGKVRGHCYDNRGGIITKSNGAVQGAIPVAGALVIARDANGAVIDFTIADENGAYLLEYMGIGTATVSAHRIWFNPASESVEITDQNLDVQVYFGMSPVVSNVEVPSHRVGTSLNLYPNPAGAQATLTFNSPAGHVSIAVVDVTGTVRQNLSLISEGGLTTATLNTVNLPSGLFMVHVTTIEGTFALPLQVVR